MAPKLWYLFRYLPREWRFALARALVWGGGYVSIAEFEPHDGSVRSYRLDEHGNKWYHQSWLSPPPFTSEQDGLQWRIAEGKRALVEMEERGRIALLEGLLRRVLDSDFSGLCQECAVVQFGSELRGDIEQALGVPAMEAVGKMLYETQGRAEQQKDPPA